MSRANTLAQRKETLAGSKTIIIINHRTIFVWESQTDHRFAKKGKDRGAGRKEQQKCLARRPKREN
jgi:hypothetical protein